MGVCLQVLPSPSADVQAGPLLPRPLELAHPWRSASAPCPQRQALLMPPQLSSCLLLRAELGESLAEETSLRLAVFICSKKGVLHCEKGSLALEVCAQRNSGKA